MGASVIELEAQAMAQQLGVADGGISPLSLRPITVEEMTKAKLTPRVVLRDLLYADVRIRAAAGGTVWAIGIGCESV